MKHLSRVVVLVTLFFLSLDLTGCTTMFGRQFREEEVYFDANISNVEVTCSGKRTKTPGSIPLAQSRNHACSAEKEGYERQVFKIQSGTSWSGFAESTALNTAAWGWWTMGIGTGVGWLTDFASGGMRNLKGDHIYLQMEPLKKTGEASPETPGKVSGKGAGS